MIKATSENRFTFTGSVSADGEHVTMVASKDDHEGKKVEVFRFTPGEASKLHELIQQNCETAKSRRKAIRQAAKDAKTLAVATNGTTAEAESTARRKAK